MQKLYLYILVFLSLLSCAKKQEQEQKINNVELRLVHSPGVAELATRIKEGYQLEYGSSISNAQIDIKLIPEHDIRAANKIATGEIKSEVWLTSSSDLVNYTNDRIINLGAKQSDCNKLFRTPIVLVTKSSELSTLRHNQRKFSWENFFNTVKIQANEDRAIDSLLSIILPSVSKTPSGFYALKQLVFFAAANNNISGLHDNSEFLDLLQAVTAYEESEKKAIQRLDGIANKISFAIVSEQQLISVNKESSGALYAALYPSDGSVWLDYMVCYSQADWVTPLQLAALKNLSKYLQSEHAQKIFIDYGYRPTKDNIETKELLTNNFKLYGAELLAEGGSLPEISTHSLSQLINNLAMLLRPSATIYLIDTSGTMLGAALSSGKRMIRSLIASHSKADVGMLVSFADRAKIVKGFDTGSAEQIQALDALEAGGGSALYDAMKQALHQVTSREIMKYRKNIIIFTDGKDNKSNTSFTELHDAFKDIKKKFDINFNVVAVKNEGVDFADLQKLTKLMQGKFFLVSPSEVDKVLAEILEMTEATSAL